jgi:hypothetical protein
VGKILALRTISDLLVHLIEEGRKRFFVRWTKITSNIRFEDRLEGVSNYLQWKVRINSVLKENKLWSFANLVVPEPTYTTYLYVHEVNEAKT